jgi:hypothetical protein
MRKGGLPPGEYAAHGAPRTPLMFLNGEDGVSETKTDVARYDFENKPFWKRDELLTDGQIQKSG